MSNSIGDLKNSGLQGNNFPWQLKMLEGLQKIYDEVKKPLTCAEDSISLCDGQGHSLDILPNGSINVNVLNSIPVAIDCNDRISLCVNGAVVNAANSLPVTVVNPLPLEVDINQANDSILIYGFDGVNNQPISVDTNGYVNVTVTIPTPLPVSQDPSSDPWTVDGTVNAAQSGSWTVALDAATLAALEDVTVQQGTSPWIISATDLDIRDLTFATDSVDVSGSNVNAVVTATDLDIRDLTFATDSVDVTGSDVTVSNTVTVQATALDIRPLTCGDEVSLCANGITVDSGNPLPVDAGSLTPSADGVGMYGSTDGGTNWTAVQVDSFGVVSTNTTIVGPLGVQPDCANAVSTALCQTQEDILTDIKTAVEGTLDVNIVTPNVAISLDSIVSTGATGDLSSFGQQITSISFQNIGTAVATISINGGSTYFPVAPGTSINLDPRIPMGYYNGTSFFWDTTTAGAFLLIMYNYI